MPGLRDLKQRIKGIQGMRKVTKAMQLVSAAKMRKAQEAVVNSRTYAGLAWELVESVIGQNQGSFGSIPEGRSAADGLSGIQNESFDLDPSPEMHSAGMGALLQTHPNAKKIGVIVLTSNRGLVGSLNTNLQPLIKKLGADADVITEMVVYGKHAKNIAVRLNKNIMADFQKADRKITTEDIYPIAEFISSAYKTGQYKKIVIVYNHFVSTLVQKASVKQLLPFAREEGAGKREDNAASPLTPNPSSLDFLFEPTPEKVLEHLLPRIIESQLYETILESDASEHSARMVMMKNATEAAGDLIDDYKLTYNQLRQGKITTELSEITAGRIALE